MLSLRQLTIAAAAATFSLAGCAETPADHSAHHADPAASASAAGKSVGAGGPMARMDEQMKAMREMHDKMMQAKTPEERSALMSEHMKLMQNGMALMGGMGGMGGMKGKDAMAGDMAAHHHTMEKHMEMMDSMMQMMVDRMGPLPAR